MDVNKVEVRVEIGDGNLQLRMVYGESELVAILTPDDVTNIVAAMLRYSVMSYHPNGQSSTDFTMPMQKAEDVKAPILWPMQTAILTAVSEPAGVTGTGFIAAYGLAQVFIGLQRNQIKHFADHLLGMDARLPPSDEFLLGDGMIASDGIPKQHH